MITRTKAILKSLRIDGAVDLTNAQVKRIVESYCAAKGIAAGATLTDSCVNFVRYFRREMMEAIKAREASLAADSARAAAVQVVDSEVDLGND